jgi:zinc transport system permease protein
MILFEGFFLRALLGGIGIAALAGPLGCFMVWRRMAYFSDALAHSALLGVVVGITAGLSANLGIVLVCSLFALLILFLQQRQVLATDTLLGLLAHSSLSLGLLAVEFQNQVTMDGLHSFLFGDVLAITTEEIRYIYAGGGAVLITLCWLWKDLMLTTLHADLAAAEGVKTFRTQALFMLLMTIVIALSIRVVGVLLITSLMLIPAAAARQFARSPQAMAMMASLIGILAVIGGLFLSLWLDTSSGPSIVVMASGLFLLSLLAQLVPALRPYR